MYRGNYRGFVRGCGKLIGGSGWGRAKKGSWTRMNYSSRACAVWRRSWPAWCPTGFRSSPPACPAFWLPSSAHRNSAVQKCKEVEIDLWAKGGNFRNRLVVIHRRIVINCNKYWRLIKILRIIPPSILKRNLWPWVGLVLVRARRGRKETPSLRVRLVRGIEADFCDFYILLVGFF